MNTYEVGKTSCTRCGRSDNFQMICNCRDDVKVVSVRDVTNIPTVEIICTDCDDFGDVLDADSNHIDCPKCHGTKHRKIIFIDDLKEVLNK